MKLKELWDKVDDCDFCKTSKNSLQHIHGGGYSVKPKAMFVFINPTHGNMSTSPEYTGPRTPFLGTKQVWKVFVKAGLLPLELLEKTNSTWDKQTINYVLKTMGDGKIYFTNVSKCAKNHPDPPTKKEVEYGKDILFEEINIVQPKRIVAMGLLPFKALTGKTIKLNEQLKLLQTYKTEIKENEYEILPCFFPVGRGNPNKAIEILKAASVAQW